MIFIILTLTTVLRFISLNQSLWLDEATSALTTQMSLSKFFTSFLPGDFHPPLYYLSLRLWSLIFGSSEVVLRIPSIIFGILTIYLVYKLSGKIAALFLGTSGLFLYYTQEARMYVMSTFLVTLSVYSFTKILHKEARVGYWFIFASTLGLIALTDYLPLLILLVFISFAIFTKQSISWWKKYITSHIILLVVSLIWLPTFIKQLTSGINVTHTSPAWVQVLGTFSIKDILLIPVKFAIGRVGFDNKYLYALIIILIFTLFSYLFVKSIKFIRTQKLIYLWLLLPLTLALIISIKIPVLNYFRFLFILPAFYIILALGIKSQSRYKNVCIALILAINLITSGIYLFTPKFQRENWRGAVNYIEHERSKVSEVIFPANSQMEAYRYYAPNASISGPQSLDKLHKEVWLIRYAQPISDPQDTTRKEIESLGLHKIAEYDFNGVVVWKYNK